MINMYGQCCNETAEENVRLPTFLFHGLYYHIALNFRGSKFLQITIFENFVEIIASYFIHQLWLIALNSLLY